MLYLHVMLYSGKSSFGFEIFGEMSKIFNIFHKQFKDLKTKIYTKWKSDVFNGVIILLNIPKTIMNFGINFS